MKLLKQFGILIDGSEWDKASDYENQIETLLNTINSTQVGAKLLYFIKSAGDFGVMQGQLVRIKPYFGTCNALANGHSPLFSADYSTVEFSPVMFKIGNPHKCNNSSTAGANPDEILFHELIHSLRQISRKWRKGKLPKLDPKYTNDEEFIAVMVTNIYISISNRQLRDSHSNFGINNDQLSWTTLLLDEERELVKVFIRDHPSLSKVIQGFNTSYNPIRAYLSK